MKRVLLGPLVAAVVCLLPASAGGQAQPLLAVVGTNDAAVITLRDANGNPVTRLDPGTYTIQVSDRSDFHNFHLLGPGVDQQTPVTGKVETTWTVTFADGNYVFQCDPHISTMQGRFVVGTPAPFAQPPATTRRVLTLAGVVTRARITLALGGSRVRSVAAGTFRIVVRDRSTRDNFHLVGPGVNRRTGIRFTGTVRWSVRLRAHAVYRYRSDARPALRGSFRTH